MRQLAYIDEREILLGLGVCQTRVPACVGVGSLEERVKDSEGISGWRVVDLKMDGMSTGQLQLALGQTD